MSFKAYLEGINYYTTTPLQDYVIKDIITNSEDNENYAKEVITYGCKSGIVPNLIYHNDCEKFFTEFMDEILEIFDTTLRDAGSVPFEVNTTNLAWFGYESVLLDLYYDYDC